MSASRPRPRERWTIGETEVPLPWDWEGLWLRYRLSREGYIALLEYQQGRCACCGRLPRTAPLVVDHREGRVWGLLLDGCNRPITDGMVAYLRDPPAFHLSDDFGRIPPEVEARNAERAKRNRKAQRDWRARKRQEAVEQQPPAGKAAAYGEWLADRLR